MTVHQRLTYKKEKERTTGIQESRNLENSEARGLEKEE